MYKEIIVVLLLVVSAFLEGSLTSLPIVLVFLITIAAQTKSSRVYVYALIGGCLLDILTGRTLGITALVLSLLLFLIFLYQRKYEINSSIFIFFASTILSLFFGLVFKTSHLLMHVLISMLLAQTIYLFWNVLYLNESTTSSYST